MVIVIGAFLLNLFVGTKIVRYDVLNELRKSLLGYVDIPAT